MENKIDSSYFWGRLRIGNVADVVTQNTVQSKAVEAKQQELNNYIRKYQPEFLRLLLGETVGANPTAEIMALIVDEDARISPIANYVFCKYQLENMSYATASGEKKLSAPNTTDEDVRMKIANAWNEMVDLNQIIHQKLYEAGGTYENDILNNLAVCVDYVEKPNGVSSIILNNNIFSKKSKYDFNR